MKIAEAFVEVRPDTDKFGRDLESSVGTAGASAGKKLQAALQGALVLKSFGALKDAAKDLGEAQNGTGLIFDKSKGKIDAFTQAAAKGLGLSERAAREATTSLGGLLQNLGFAEEASADWATTLTTLGADLGSAFNKEPAEAVQAIGAALRGETEPIRQFNVQLDDATIRAKAVELGLASTTAGVNTHGKAQAALALIMEQTAKVQGDFANTATDAANAERVAAAVRENSAASMGKGFLPIYEAAVGTVTNLGEAFGKLPQPIQSTVVAGAGLALLASPIRTAVSAVGDLSGSLVNLTKNADGSTRALGNIGKVALGAAGVAVLAVGIDKVTDALSKLENGTANPTAMSKAIVQLGQDGKATGELTKQFGDDLGEIGEKFRDATEAGYPLLDMFGESASNVRDAKRDLDAVDDSLANLVRGGNADVAKAAFDRIAAAAAEQGVSLESVKKRLGDYADALTEAETQALLAGKGADKAKSSATGLAGALTTVAGSGEDAADALAKVAAAQAATLSSGIDYERSLLSLEEANAAVTEAQKALAAGGGGVARSQFDVAAAARAVEDAQRGVADAHRRVEDAQRGVQDAARGVETAMLAQETAQERVTAAQDRLTDSARRIEEAWAAVVKRQVDVFDRQKDLDKILRGSGSSSKEAADATENLDDRSRDLERAQIGVTEAQARLNEVQADGKSTALDVQKATLDLRDAQDRLQEADVRRTQALTELGEVTKGVTADHAKAREAQDRLKDAQDRLTEATRKAKEEEKARTEAQKAVVEAHRGVTEAARGLEEAHRGVADAARDVTDAERGVRDAIREVAEAEEKRRAGAGPANAATKSRAELERDLKNAILDQRQAYIDTAQTYADQAATVAEANGKTLTAVERHELFKQKLRELTDQLSPTSPLRQSLAEYIGQVNNLATAIRSVNDVSDISRFGRVGHPTPTGRFGDGPGDLTGAGGSARAMAAAITSQFGGVITSGYRTPEHNRAIGGSPTSYHLDPNNPAVDIAGGNLSAIFGALEANFGHQVRELIYGNVMVKKGKRYHYGANDHWDHVHVAHQGGIVDSSWPTLPGLRSDERPAVLQTGEQVIPRGGNSGPLIGQLVVNTQRFNLKDQLHRASLLRPRVRTA